MEHLSQFRTALFNTAGKEFGTFSSALKEELARRK